MKLWIALSLAFTTSAFAGSPEIVCKGGNEIYRDVELAIDSEIVNGRQLAFYSYKRGDSPPWLLREHHNVSMQYSGGFHYLNYVSEQISLRIDEFAWLQGETTNAVLKDTASGEVLVALACERPGQPFPRESFPVSE